MLIQQLRYRSMAFPRADRIAGRRCSQRHVPAGEGWGCECLQTLTVIRRPETPALPLLRPEMGKLWRCYASIFLAKVWVHIPFPPGCLRVDKPWQSLLLGPWCVSPTSLRVGAAAPAAPRHVSPTGLSPSCAIATVGLSCFSVTCQASNCAFVCL